MSVSFTTDNEQLTCAFSGRLDTVTCMEVKNEVETTIANHAGTVIFDLEQVEYISSSFLRLCANGATAVGRDNFSIINVTPMIKKVFMIAGLIDKLNIS